MPNVPDPGQFIRALTLYFGDASNPGYDPVKALDGQARIASAFPTTQGKDLSAQIDQMFDAAFDLPGVDGEPLDDAVAVIRAFIASEYPYLPPVLQAKVVNRCAYGLWK